MRYKGLAVSLAALSCVGCSRTPTTPQTEAPSTDHAVLVRLEGRNDTVVIKTGPTAPLYSLLTSDGRIILQDMTLTQIAAHDPELYERIKTAVAAQARIEALSPSE